MLSFEVVKSDITNMYVDAIVNSANTSLRMGSGMCRSVYQKAGEDFLLDFIEKSYGSNFMLNPGEAIITPGFNLSAKHILHTVTPKYYIGSERKNIEIMSCCYVAIIQAASKVNVKNIAIPCLGVGHHCWPLELAVSIALDTLYWLSDKIEKDINVIFSCYTQEQYVCYQKAINKYMERSVDLVK